MTDEPTIAQLALACLRFAGYATELTTVAEALSNAERLGPELLIIDTSRLKSRGAALVRELRTRYLADTSVLLLAEAHDVDAAAMALTVGGAKYLVKPFSLDDLTAHVRALLRHATEPEARPHSVLRFADLELDEDTLDARRGGHVLQLSPRERRILRYLLVNAGRTVTRTEIIEHVWPYNHRGHRRALDVHICNLRREIKKTGMPLIQTLYGVGYCLREPQPVHGRCGNSAPRSEISG